MFNKLRGVGILVGLFALALWIANAAFSIPQVRQVARETIGYHAQSLQQAQENLNKTEDKIADTIKDADKALSDKTRDSDPAGSLEPQFKAFLDEVGSLSGLRSMAVGDLDDFEKKWEEAYANGQKEIEQIQSRSMQRQQQQLWVSRKQQIDEKLDATRKLVAQLYETLAEGKDVEHVARSLELYEQTGSIGGKIDNLKSDLSTKIATFREHAQSLQASLSQATANNVTF